MSDVLVRNLDEAALERLKSRASQNGRSLQAELKLILEEASRAERVDRHAYRLLAEKIRRELGPGPHGDSGALQAEDRER